MQLRLICSPKTGSFRVRVFRDSFLRLRESPDSDAQKAFVLRQGADGVPVADIYRKAGSQATYFNWKKK
jgi:hypothetical protein